MTREVKKLEKTEVIELTGIANWAKLYKPDEFRGAIRWTLALDLDEASVEKYKEYGIQQKLKDGKTFNPRRDTTRTFKGKVVNFTPPVIFDKNGEVLVKYVNSAGKAVFSYEGEAPTRVGEPVLIGNGSLVAVKVSVYPTSMGVGNRLEAVKILDLITYESPTGGTNGVDSVEW